VLRKAISVAGYEPPSLQPGASAGNHDIESAQHTQQERHKSARAADRVEEVLHQSMPGRSRDPRWTKMRSSLGRAVSVSLHTHTSFAAVITSLILLRTSSRLMWRAAAAHARPAPESQGGSCISALDSWECPCLSCTFSSASCEGPLFPSLLHFCVAHRAMLPLQLAVSQITQMLPGTVMLPHSLISWLMEII